MIDINDKRLRKTSEESERQYIWRIGQMYDNKLISKEDVEYATWSDLGELFNQELQISEEDYKTESAYRKQYQSAVKYYEEVFKSMIEDDKCVKDLEDKILELKKERVKNRDVSNNINQKVREMARIENLKEIAVDMAREFNKDKPFLNISHKTIESDKSGILVLSDWHFGLEIENFLNKYNEDIFKDRISQVVEQTIEKIKLHKLEKLYVLNLNDLISGAIHTIIRIQNRQDLIQQIMIVSETLAEMLVELNNYIDVEYYSTLDNHSRATPNKKDSLEKENFSILIDWYLVERLKSTNIIIKENEIEDGICTFQIYDWKYLAVHGDKDRVSNVVQNLSLMTKRFYDVMMTAHLHHAHSDEVHQTYVFSNGSLSGVDSYAKDLRRTSNPSQTLLITSKKDCVDSVCILKLK